MKVVLTLDVDMGCGPDDDDDADDTLNDVVDALASVDAERALSDVVGNVTGYVPETLTVVDYKRSTYR